ncbi:hypothetical protein AAEX63_15380 [Luteococcus sp. H138]|uniref:hypothetical protein n=1 Tax=unclassified Luteococcus TaxID=2639923 RepID=UPI00313EA397
MIHSPIERRIATRVVADLLAVGYAVSVDNGVDIELRKSRDPEAIGKALAGTDADWLHAHGKDGKACGWVLLAYGNGTDLVSDYTTNLADALAGAEALANKLDG